MLCVPLTGPTTKDVLRQVENTEQLADLFELRWDKIEDKKEILELLKNHPKPFFVTGHNGEDVGQYLRSEDFPQVLKENPYILAYHNFKGTPDNLLGLLYSMQTHHAKIYKIACHAKSSLDSLRMLNFVRKYPEISIAGMCMGDFGQITRILAPLVGNDLTFASSSEEECTAPGQLTAHEICETYNFKSLNSASKLIALIGNPLPKTSQSHVSHNKVLKSCNINGVYTKIPLGPEDIPKALHYLKKINLRGLCVTMPLKEEIMKHLDAIDPKAKAIGAVNTVVYREGKLWGHNTDGIGALDAIEAKRKVAGKQVLIVGAGGAAKAIAHEALSRGAKVKVLNRSEDRAEKLAKELKCAWGPLSSMKEELTKNPDFLIQTTSVGMTPNDTDTIVPAELIPSSALVMDAVWVPEETQLLKDAAVIGCETVSGKEMFINQAVEQFGLWFDSICKNQVREVLCHVLHRQTVEA